MRVILDRRQKSILIFICILISQFKFFFRNIWQEARKESSTSLQSVQLDCSMKVDLFKNLLSKHFDTC